MASAFVNGTSIEYEVFGPPSGTPVLLISGYTSQLTNWPMAFIDPLVEQGYRVIRFDNRDIGLSHQFDDKGIPNIRDIASGLKDGTAADKAPYLLNDMADDAAALLVELNAAPALVMGVSMGGMITQILALRHPDKVKAIVPTMTTSGRPGLPGPTEEAQAALLDRPASVSRLAIMESAVKSRKAFGSAPPYRPTNEEIAERAGQAFDRAYRPAGISRQYAAIVAQPRWHDDLPGLKVPTLVLHGSVDTLIPPACGKDVAERIPGAKFVEIENWGHDLPDAVAPALHQHVMPFFEANK